MDGGVRLQFSQHGDFDTFDIIRSPTSLAEVDDADLPDPIAVGLSTMYYIDTNVTDGIYFYKARVWRDGLSVVSDQIRVEVSTFSAPYNLTVEYVE